MQFIACLSGRAVKTNNHGRPTPAVHFCVCVFITRGKYVCRVVVMRKDYEHIYLNIYADDFGDSSAFVCETYDRMIEIIARTLSALGWCVLRASNDDGVIVMFALYGIVPICPSSPNDGGDLQCVLNCRYSECVWVFMCASLYTKTHQLHVHTICV